MTDKDQFIFDEDDEFPEIKREDQHTSPELDVSNDDFPGTGMGDHQASSAPDLGKEDFPEISREEQQASLELDGRDDGFPETGLSASFADEEHSADGPAEDNPGINAQDGGSPRPRPLLMILLLLIVCAAGAYYFMDLGGTAPTVPTVSVPAQSVSKSIALPPKTIPEPPVPNQTETATSPASVTVAPPPPPGETAGPQTSQPLTESGSPSAPAEQSGGQKDVATSMPEPAKQMEAPPAAPGQNAGAAAQATTAAVKPETAPAPPATAAVAPPENKVAAKPMPAPELKQVAKGTYSLDAGSYLFESNRDSLVAKIEKLGYEPIVTPVDATLDMTRLRLGTYSKGEIQDALAFARTIEPGAYSTQAGDRYIVYAGTFMKSGNVAKLTKRFLEEGVTVHPEPVQVVRTLSRIRFGSFATKEDAAAAAREISNAGMPVEVVKFK
jgi:hypothetical protein